MAAVTFICHRHKRTSAAQTPFGVSHPRSSVFFVGFYLLFDTLFLRKFFSRLIYWFELKWFYSAHDEESTKKQFVLKFFRTITRPKVIPITYVTGSFGRPLI